MTEIPDLGEWEFPTWLRCICEGYQGFDKAKEILVVKYGFVPSPFEPEEDYDRALVLPRPDISLKDILTRAEEDMQDFKGWGIGRVRFNRGKHPKSRTSYDFKYFIDLCPRHYIESNPFREPVIELHKLLQPIKFIDQTGEDVPFPYQIKPAAD